jgi:hypothetical protein
MEPNSTPQQNNESKSIPQKPLDQNLVQQTEYSNSPQTKNTDSKENVRENSAQAEIDKQIKMATNKVDIKKTSDPDLPRLRTFQDDVKNAVDTNNISTSKMFLAEQAKRDRVAKKQQKNMGEFRGPINVQDNILQPNAAKIPNQIQERPKKKIKVNKKVLVSLISLTLFVAGGFGIYYNMEYLKPYFDNARVRVQTEPIYFIDPENKLFIETDNLTKGEIIRDYQNIISNNNTSEIEDVTEIVMTENTVFESEGETRNATQRISVEKFLSTLDANPPENLVRSFEGSVLLGFYNSGEAQPFVIIKSEDLSQTYAGMLAWEFRLGTDIGKIFFQNLNQAQQIINDQYALPEIQTASSTATTTTATTTEDIVMDDTSTTTSTTTASVPEVQIPEFNPDNFVDLVISNRDVRAVLNANNEIVFFYSLVDNENVVITTNKNTFDKVLNKLNNAKLIR